MSTTTCSSFWLTIYFLWWTCFQQTVGRIPMDTNCAPLLADLFLFSYVTDFIQRLLKKNEKKLVRSFNFTFRYIDDVLSLNNFSFGDFVDRIYPIELEIKDTKDTDRSASYLDLHLEIDSEGRLRTKLYDKRDDLNFPIVNFPFICSNLPAAPAYEVYISQLIRYSRACGSYQDFLDWGLLLTRKLLNQRFLLVISWSHHFESFKVATMTWLTAMEYLCHKWSRICSTCPKHFPVLSSFMTYYRICN